MSNAYVKNLMEQMGNQFAEYGEYRQKTLAQVDMFSVEEAYMEGFDAGFRMAHEWNERTTFKTIMVMANKELKKFNVLNWGFNTDNIEHYDVLPYLRECVKKSKKKEPIETLDDMKKFVEQKSLYMFWSRCQYEMIIHGWPVQKNNYKIDVHEQVMMNIDTIAEILFNEIKK